MSQFKQRIRKCFHQVDLFKTNANLRTKGEADTSRVCSGVFSMLLIGFFMYIFITQLIKVFNYDSITSKETFETQTNFDLPSASNLKISISPTWQYHSYWSQYFNVTMYLVSEQKADANGEKINPPKYTKLQTQICQLSMWSKFKEIYDGFQLNENLCIKDPSTIQISGSNPLGKIQYFYIRIAQLANANITAFNYKMMQLVKRRLNFASFFMTDASINSQAQNPVEEYIPLDVNLYYTYTSRKSLNLYLGTYSISTDKNIFPSVESAQQRQGYYINSKRIYDIETKVDKLSYPDQVIYGEVYIYMTNERKRFQRAVGKIDNVISYAGGLFGIFIAFFAYCVFNYNRYSYELIVAETAFSNDGHSSKMREKDFNFFRYIKYQIFNWVNTLFRCQIPWADCKKIEESRNEANMYMDVNSLFRRIQLFELLLSYLVDDKKFKLIQLTEPPSISMVKEKRLMIEYYEQIVGADVAIKFEDVITQNESFILYNEKELRKRKKKHEVEESNEDKLEKKQRIKESMMSNLRIENEKFLEGISNFPEIERKANKVKLKKEMMEIQVIFTKALLGLKERRSEIIEKIPLKIIFRLAKCAESLNQEVMKKVE